MSKNLSCVSPKKGWGTEMKGKKIACLQSQLVSKQKRRKPLSDNDCLGCQKGLEPPTPALGVWRDHCRTERT